MICQDGLYRHFHQFTKSSWSYTNIFPVPWRLQWAQDRCIRVRIEWFIDACRMLMTALYGWWVKVCMYIHDCHFRSTLFAMTNLCMQVAQSRAITMMALPFESSMYCKSCIHSCQGYTPVHLNHLFTHHYSKYTRPTTFKPPRTPIVPFTHP